jgi:fructokinase
VPTATFGGIEAGGTKWVCAVGSTPEDLPHTTTFPTTSPAETLRRAAEFLAAHGPLEAVGVGSFGPLDLVRGSSTWGHITTTPKPGWANVDLATPLRTALGCPVAVDTDVNAAALGEARWGAAVGEETFCYITVGTGLGGGVMANGALVHGLIHPEFGHMRIPHDTVRDPFEGICPYHGDCLEGLASGEAIRRRWGFAGNEQWHDEAVFLESEYLALGLLNVVCALSPQRVILGGGVMKQPRLLPLVRNRLQEIAAGYFAAPQLLVDIDEYVVPPTLGDRAGVLGAIELARLSLG